jgi:hypothetical protein
MNKYELFEIIEKVIRTNNFIANSDNIDGRVNSIKDEDTIKNILLNSELKEYIRIPRIRECGDFSVMLDGKTIIFNIKTTNGNSADNIFSKNGTLLAFTDIPEDELTSNVSWEKFARLLKERKADNDRDYYYLVVNKTSGDIFIRGLKSLQTIKSNPSNILQVNWSREFTYLSAQRSFEQAYEYVLGIIVESLRKDTQGKNNVIDLYENKE